MPGGQVGVGWGGTVFREQARPGLGAPEWPVVRAARWVDLPQAPGDPDSADPEPGGRLLRGRALPAPRATASACGWSGCHWPWAGNWNFSFSPIRI